LLAIGGVGGSGTRLGAALLQMLGFYIGDDLNPPLDNLWFTLFFKRRTILLEGETQFRELFSLFLSRMSGQVDFRAEERALVLDLASGDRLQHSRDWLLDRATTFLTGTTIKQAGQVCGWKEPNTHLVIERMLSCCPELRYLHFARHPLDMAASRNQNQLELWGPILANRDVAISARESLSYWCAAHRRILAVMRRWPERMMMVDFDALCAAPEVHAAGIARFVGLELSDPLLSAFRGMVDPDRPSRGRFTGPELKQFRQEDLSYVEDLGYRV